MSNKNNIPVYLDAQVEAYLAAVAKRKDIELSKLVNDLLKKTIKIITFIPE